MADENQNPPREYGQTPITKVVVLPSDGVIKGQTPIAKLPTPPPKKP